MLSQQLAPRPLSHATGGRGAFPTVSRPHGGKKTGTARRPAVILEVIGDWPRLRSTSAPGTETVQGQVLLVKLSNNVTPRPEVLECPCYATH